MQATANFHDHISCPRLPETADVVDDAAALDATVHRLDPHPAPCDAPIDSFLRTREGSPRGFLVGMITSTWGSVNARKPRS